MKLVAVVLSGSSSVFVENSHAAFNKGIPYQHDRAKKILTNLIIVQKG